MVFYVTRVTFRMTLSYEEVNKYCHGRWTCSSMGQNPTFSCQQLVTKHCHGRLKLGWRITWSVTVIATMQIYNPPRELQGMTNDVGLTSSVGLQLVLEQDDWNWWH